MGAVIIICSILCSGYIVLMLLYRKGWGMQHRFSMPADFKPVVFVSIIIPARNEENNIGACINSILSSDYPHHLFEIIVIDDHSTDNTATVVASFNDPGVKCIKLAEHISACDEVIAYKKKALTTGIATARGDLIITTDADCTMSPLWLRTMAAKFQTEQPAMIVAPVDFTSDGSVIQTFQSLDFMSMQGITAASHAMKMGNMSNGANLAFAKSAFYEVDGYTGIDHLASGDDYLLMMKLQKKYPSGIGYLRSSNAIVETAPQPDWSGFLQQRIRWASKSGKYDDKKMTGVLMFVYIFNVSFLVLLIAAIFNIAFLEVAGAMLIAKIVIELFYLYPVAAFFKKRKQLYIFPLLQPVHILYIITAGLLGFIGVYSWKGRSVK